MNKKEIDSIANAVVLDLLDSMEFLTVIEYLEENEDLTEDETEKVANEVWELAKTKVTKLSTIVSN